MMPALGRHLPRVLPRHLQRRRHDQRLDPDVLRLGHLLLREHGHVQRRANVVIGEGATRVAPTTRTPPTTRSTRRPTTTSPASAPRSSSVRPVAWSSTTPVPPAPGPQRGVQHPPRRPHRRRLGSVEERVDHLGERRARRWRTATSTLDLPGQLHVPESLLADPARRRRRSQASTSRRRSCPRRAPGHPSTPIIDISFATGAPSKVFIPGYVAVPQGRSTSPSPPGSGAGKDVHWSAACWPRLFSQTARPAGRHCSSA